MRAVQLTDFRPATTPEQGSEVERLLAVHRDGLTIRDQRPLPGTGGVVSVLRGLSEQDRNWAVGVLRSRGHDDIANTVESLDRETDRLVARARASATPLNDDPEVRRLVALARDDRDDAMSGTKEARP